MVGATGTRTPGLLRENPYDGATHEQAVRVACFAASWGTLASSISKSDNWLGGGTPFDGSELVVFAKLILHLLNDRLVTSADCDRAFPKPVIRQFGARLPEALHQSLRSLPLRIVLDHEWSALLNFGLRLPARQAPNQSFKLQFINDFRYLRYPRYLDKWVSANEPLPVTH